jgi:putative ABC transport system ATP-binding protein
MLPSPGCLIGLSIEKRGHGEVAASNLSLLDEEGQPIVEGISARLPEGGKLALVAMLLARLMLPSGGQLSIADKDSASLPEAATGRRIGYVGPAAFVFSNTMRANLLLGAMNQPLSARTLGAAEATERDEMLKLAGEAGNSSDDPTADWIDYAAIGIDGPEELAPRLMALLEIVDMEEDVYQLGLRGVIDPREQPIIAKRALETRVKLRDRLAEADFAGLVEPFDESLYNTNATVAENLLFGTPVGTTFDLDNLAQNTYVRSVLDKTGLTQEMLEVSRELAATMVELFSDLPPDHEFFQQFSFISAEDLPEFQILLGRVERLGMDKLEAEDRDQFLGLPFKLIPARHRLGLIGEDMREKLLQARKIFAAELPVDLKSAIESYSILHYNAAASLQDNVLFGKIAYGQADAVNRVGAAMAEIIRAEGLRPAVFKTGLDFETGIGGARLSATQRQKLAIAHTLLRRPDILIFNEATAALDSGSQSRVMAAVMQEIGERTLIWTLQRASLASQFDRAIVIKSGQIVEDGAFADLSVKEGGALKASLDEE